MSKWGKSIAQVKFINRFLSPKVTWKRICSYLVNKLGPLKRLFFARLYNVGAIVLIVLAVLFTLTGGRVPW